MQNIIRALRLPFITASVLPFIFGSVIGRGSFNTIGFILGLAAVIATHLAVNLINDYADSRSGADWQDRTFYGFFGGSKLIQEGVLSERFYLYGAIICALIAFLAVAMLALVLKAVWVTGLYLLILFLSWAYSHAPLRLSYRRMGEIFIFLLFGPVPVMGGYFIQAGIFPDMKSFILSLPFGFLTAAILFANEVPDFSVDKKTGKFTMVSVTGQKQAFLFYLLLVACAFFAIIYGVTSGYLNPCALFSLVFILPAIKAAQILKRHPQDKAKLVESSRLTIALQNLTGLSLIIVSILCGKS